MLSKPLQTKPVHSVSELAPYLDGWRTLASGRPMRSPEWLLGWWKIYASPGDKLNIILVVEPGGALVGLAPLYLQNGGTCATFRVLGARDNCTHHTDWLSAAGWESRVGGEVALFLLRCRQDWKRLLFEAVDADADALHATVAHLTENGCLGHRRPINSCWKISLPATWDDYLLMLSRSLRKRCRKLQRQFFDSGKIRIRQVEEEADLREGFQTLLELHADRWGSAGQPLGVFSDPKFRKFHELISKGLLAQSKLRLAWLEYEGKPIAIEYQFFDEETVYAYQAGLDLSMDKCSPGKLSMMAAIQFAIAKGCKSYDLLGGDEPYKANWRAAPVARHDLRVWNAGIRAHLEWAGWRGYSWAVRRLKPIIPQRLIAMGLKFIHAAGKVRILRRRSA